MRSAAVDLRGLVDEDEGPVVTTPSRITASFTTGALAADAEGSVSATLGKASELYSISTDRAARVRAYSTAAHRLADVDRPAAADPAGNHGLLLEVITDPDLLSLDLSPVATLVNMDTPPLATIYFAVRNLDAAPATVTVTMKLRVTE